MAKVNFSFSETTQSRGSNSQTRSKSLLQYLFYRSHHINGKQVDHASISDAFFMMTLSISTIIAVIIAFNFENIHTSSKIALCISAMTSCLAAISLMKWPHYSFPAILPTIAILLTIVETAYHTSGSASYAAPFLLSIMLTILMVDRDLKLILNLVFFLFAFIFTASAALGIWGVPSTLTPKEMALLQFLFLTLNIIHVSAITLTFKASQAVQTALLVNQKEALIEVNKERRNFLAMASHELRTPMNALMGSLEILDNSSDPKLRKDIRGLVRDAAKGLSTQLDDLLDLSNLENGQLKFSPAPNNIVELTKRTLEIWQTQASDNLIHLTLNYDEESNCELLVDSARIQQVINNLISKAIGTTNSGDITVNLSCMPSPTEEHTFVRILISDSGTQSINDIKDETITPDTSASSIQFNASQRFGFHVARLIAQRMQGEIEILKNSASGSNYLFTFHAPLVKTSTSNDTFLNPSPNRLRILCVDDHPANLRILYILLAENDLDVDVAMSGEEAVKLCASQRRYDAILMDIMMPGINGVEACIEIKKLDTPNANIPIIAVTANVAPENIALYLDSGMQAVVSKPIESRKLIGELHQTLKMIAPKLT